MSALLFLAVISCAVAEQTIGVYNQMLDPGRLTWWQTQWSPGPVSLSQSNAKATDVTMTFYFTPTTTISGGVLEATCPGLLSITQVPLSCQAGEDVSISIGPIDLPNSEGAYGPCSLISRLSATGQMIDANLNFAMVYVTEPAVPFSSAKLLYGSPGNTTVLAQDNEISFFLILQRDLWKYDMFKITSDPQFTVNLAEKNCSSATRYDPEGVAYINYYNGTEPDSHSLDCLATEKMPGQPQVIWIYGLASEYILLNLWDEAKTIDLRVPGITNPDQESVEGSWIIETVRFGTSHTIEYTVNHVNFQVSAAPVQSINWKPTWGLAPERLPTSLQVYTDLSFTLSNPVPAGGYVEVKFVEERSVVVGLCHVTTSPALQCSTTSSTLLTLTPYQTLAPYTTIVVRFVVKIVHSESFTAEVCTYYASGGRRIDKGTVGLSVADPLAVVVFSLSVLLQNRAGNVLNQAGGTGDSTQMIVFKFDGLSNNLLQNSNVMLFCPFASAPSDFQIGLPAGLTTEYKDDGGVAFSTITGKVGGVPTSNHGSEPVLRPAAWSSISPGTMGFAAGALQAGKPSVTYAISGNYITLPKVASNAATAYECHVEIMDSTNVKALLVGVGQFVVAPQLFASVSFTAFCSNVQKGAPVRVTFLPSVLDLAESSETKTYYVEIALPKSGFNTPIGTDVLDGDLYPVASNIPTPLTMTVSSNRSVDSASVSYFVTGLGPVSTAGDPVAIYFPVSGKASVSSAATVQTFYCLNSDPRQVKYVIHGGKTQAYAQTTGAAGVSAPASLTVGSNSIVNGNAVSSFAFTTSLSTSIRGDTYFYIVFPAGYTFSNLRDVRISSPVSGSFSQKLFFSSPKRSFPYPSVLVKSTTYGAQISNTDSDISVTGLVAPIGVDPAAEWVFVHAAVNGDLNAACAAYAHQPLPVAKGTIQNLVVSPAAITGSGPGGVDITHSVSFVLPHGIDAGGSLTMTVDGAWVFYTYTVCSVTGLNGANCEVTAHTIAVTGFEDFSELTDTAVTVYIQRLMAPSQVAEINFVSALKSTAANGRDIDEFSGSSFVKVQPALQPGTFTVHSASAFPPNAGQTDCDLYMSFSASVDLAMNTELTIAIPYALTALGALNRCWLSPLMYTSCTMTSSLQITLGQAYRAEQMLEVFLLRSVTVPKTLSGSYLVSISAKWNSVVLATTKVSYSLKPTNEVITTFKGNIQFDPLNVGEVATYNFTFTPALPIAAKDQVMIKWPLNYDAYISEVTQRMESERGRYYGNCTLEGTGPVTCTADHWTLLLSGLELEANQAASLLVWGVHNPGEKTDNFVMLHLNGSAEVMEYSSLSIEGKLGSAAGLIQVRNFRANSDFTDYYLDVGLGEVNSEWQLLMRFPPQYDIPFRLCACYGYINFNETKSSQQQVQIMDDACGITNNVLAIPQFNKTEDWNILQLLVTGTFPPKFGQIRRGSDPEIWDTSVWELRSWWTAKFELLLYSADLRMYVNRTYAQLNPAYLGFRTPLKRLWVNGYDPLSRANRIVVYPGTQSQDLFITTDNCSFPVQVPSLQLTWSISPTTPASSSSLHLSSATNFYLPNGLCKIPFRVAAQRTLPKGLYYLDWDINETKASASDSRHYSDLPSTLVEIPDFAYEKYRFQVTQVPPVPAGNASLPIRVSVTNSPHSDVTVRLTVTAGGTASQDALLFQSDVNELYFSVTLAQTSASVLFSLTGTDKDAYSIQSDLLVEKAEAPRPSGGVVRVGISQITCTTVTISPVTIRPGVLYFQITQKGKVPPSFSELSAHAAFTLQSAVRNETLPSETETWQEFQVRKYREHIEQFQVEGIVSMTSTTAEPVTVGGLWAATAYQVITYLDTLNGDEPQLVLDSFVTQDIPACVSIEIQINGKVKNMLYDYMLGALAQQLNVNAVRLTNFTVEEHLMNRRLDTSGSSIVTTAVNYTSFYTILLPDRSVEDPTPLQQSALTLQGIQNFEDLLLGYTIRNYEASELLTRTPPLWTQPLQVTSFNSSAVTMKLGVSQLGKACCVAIREFSMDLLPEQVILGYAPDWTPAIHGCLQTNETTEWMIVDLSVMEENRNYYIYCAAEDDYPLWGTQMEWSPQEPLAFIIVHTFSPLKPDEPETSLLLAISLLILG